MEYYILCFIVLIIFLFISCKELKAFRKAKINKNNIKQKDNLLIKNKSIKDKIYFKTLYMYYEYEDQDLKRRCWHPLLENIKQIRFSENKDLKYEK